ncbi:unnamed protein product [Durusdinium trenchii]|uniref:RNA helicase n=1 Tax=Durusdinium trenchii TaxID=1381693 RepID=A0ABP0NE31_9DINO
MRASCSQSPKNCRGCSETVSAGRDRRRDFLDSFGPCHWVASWICWDFVVTPEILCHTMQEASKREMGRHQLGLGWLLARSFNLGKGGTARAQMQLDALWRLVMEDLDRAEPAASEFRRWRRFCYVLGMLLLMITLPISLPVSIVHTSSWVNQKLVHLMLLIFWACHVTGDTREVLAPTWEKIAEDLKGTPSLAAVAGRAQTIFNPGILCASLTLPTVDVTTQMTPRGLYTAPGYETLVEWAREGRRRGYSTICIRNQLTGKEVDVTFTEQPLGFKLVKTQVPLTVSGILDAWRAVNGMDLANNVDDALDQDAADALSGLVGWVEASCEWKLVVPTNAEAGVGALFAASLGGHHMYSYKEQEPDAYPFDKSEGQVLVRGTMGGMLQLHRLILLKRRWLDQRNSGEDPEIEDRAPQEISVRKPKTAPRWCRLEEAEAQVLRSPASVHARGEQRDAEGETSLNLQQRGDEPDDQSGDCRDHSHAAEATSDADVEEASEADEDEEVFDAESTALDRRLSGAELRLFREERGITVESLRGGDPSAKETPPVLGFDALHRCGVDAALACRARGCAGGRGATTAVQAECWGQLLRLRFGGAECLPPPESATALLAAAPAAAAQLAAAERQPLPEEDLEDPPLPFDSACSRCEVREDRDLVAIAPTGSGKTLAYLLPLLADGLCKALCPPAVGLDAIFRRFQGLYPRSFEAGRGSNDTIMERLSKAFAARKTAEVTKVIKQVAKKAAEGDKDKALREKWSKLLEDLDAEGRLRPSGLVLAPSRELAQQVGQVARDLGCAAKVILGGVDHERQREQLKNERPSLLVATPGRLRALCGQLSASAAARAQSEGRQEKHPQALLSLGVVLRLVLDEGDRLIDEGFEEDIMALASCCYRRRLTLLFSATWGAQTELLSVLLQDALKITVAGIPPVISQEVELIAKASRFRRLKDLLREFGDAKVANGAVFRSPRGREVLVFVLFKREAKSLAKMLQNEGIQSWPLEGNMSQASRSFAMQAFREAKTSAVLPTAGPAVLVATDVAARGLDVPDISHVVNYSVGLSIDGYVHRIGRCGRAGRHGTAVTFVTDGDEKYAEPLLKVLQEARQSIPPGLAEMAKDARGSRKPKHKAP